MKIYIFNKSDARKNGSFVVSTSESVAKKGANQMYKKTITTNNLPTKSGNSTKTDETIAGKHMMPLFEWIVQ